MAAAIAHTFLLLYFSVGIGQAERPLYQNPTIVLIGPIAGGKSSLGNALLGCDPRNSSCFFLSSWSVCPEGGVDSCTKETTIATGKWLGKGENITVSLSPFIMHIEEKLPCADC